MTEDRGDSPASLFRANKRRKVLRKRNIDEDQASPHERASDPLDPSEIESAAGSHSPDILPTVKRPVAKKHGIGFTSSKRSPPRDATATEVALVPRQAGSPQDLTQHDRFIKPTGKLDVIEDKHMTAYIDSKLAETRSHSAHILPQNDDHAAAAITLRSTDHRGGDPEDHSRDGADDSTSSRRKGYPYGSFGRPPKNRRRPQRDDSALARDAAVDQIMRENLVPIYDQASASETKPDHSNAEVDADEAALETWKAGLLAEMQNHKRRKPPAVPTGSSARAAAQAAPSGPKLGGSRSQREKMKALEEAKNAAGRK